MLNFLKPKFPQAVLALADGAYYVGYSIGTSGLAVGELVFNTAMTGYQEILTDPSYKQQIVTFTYPHIGNYGTNEEDIESSQIQVSGLVIRELTQHPSNWRSQQSLHQYLKLNHKVAISHVDTRAITHRLRQSGAQNAAILGLTPDQPMTPELIQTTILVAQQASSMEGQDLAQLVTTSEIYSWNQGFWQLDSGYTMATDAEFHVVVVDLGVKFNILRCLVTSGCRVSVVPAKSTFAEIAALNPHGVFLSNGPGDPDPCLYAIDLAKQCFQHKIPLMGICLGHQIMALACGGKTFKMKFGHHGSNHPVQDLHTKQVYISSQNHGFAVDMESLSETQVIKTFVSLFDGTLQGFERLDGVPALCFQGHPEASPGPQELQGLFHKFIQYMRENKYA
ncbi:MAG: glutamine-hydrolyzing carbamoyl-phosphate synthase small subunit [Gammaproteobacteria bacterium]|nr:glutamine-hydrolyzing carbamoyl-phosphate synthase small subunit [Gammaproteobacteria bacterium]